MFKKTLIAAAVVATTATFGANAATISSATSDTYNVEYAASAKQVVAPDVTVTTGRDLANGDILTITFAGADVATMTNAATPAAITPTVGHATIEFLEYDGNSVKALVTADVAAGATVTFSGVQLVISSAADKGTVKVTSVAKVATVEGAKSVDASTAAATVATFSTQFTAAVTTKLGANKIDVNDSRETFVGKKLTDTLVITNTNAVAATGSATAGAGTYVLHGDFNFLDTDGDGSLEAKEGSISSSAGTVTVAEDFMSASIAATTFTAGTYGVTITNAADSVIPAQSFTVDADVAYTVGAATGAKELLDGGDAGTWVLNGAQVFVPFLPYGSAYSQSVSVSNTSSQSGGVDLVVYVGDDTVEFEGIANVGAEGVTDISTAIRNAVATIASEGNFAMDIIVNAPESAIDVTALYYVKSEGDRVRTK